MKKLIYLLIMCIILSAFCGCSSTNTQNNKDPSVVALFYASGCESHSDSFAIKNINPEFDSWYSQRYNNTKRQEPAQEITIQFDGKEYTGKYKRTNIYSLGTRMTYEYTVDFGFLEINPSNGGVSYLLIGHPPVNRDTIDEKTYEACRKKAQEIAEQYIDTNYFTLEIKETFETVKFLYVQYINGKPTENKLVVTFTFKGEFESFCNYVSEGYKKVMKAQKTDANKLVDTFNSEQTQQLVLDKVKPLFADYEDCEYKIYQPQLHVMPDGKLMQSYNVRVTFITKKPLKDESGNPLYYEEDALLQVAIIEE